MQNIQDEKLIKKWLANKLNAEERKAFKSMKDADLLEEIVLEAKRFAPIDNLDLKNVPKPKAKKTILLPFNMHTMYRVAAIVIIAFGLFRLLTPSDLNQVQTFANERQTLNLPDKSLVRLNEVSQISYNESTWSTNRTLTLEGEAYFNVAKGEKFDVITPNGMIRVLGTSFNVNSRKNTFSVTCYEGKVHVEVVGEEFLLMPGQKLEWKEGVLNQEEDIKSQPTWLSGLHVFENVPLQKV